MRGAGWQGNRLFERGKQALEISKEPALDGLQYARSKEKAGLVDD